jgi:hypothetical protein
MLAQLLIQIDDCGNTIGKLVAVLERLLAGSGNGSYMSLVFQTGALRFN